MIIEIADKVLSGAGNKPAEVYISSSKDFRVEVADGKIENYDLSRTRGMGLRIFSGKRVGFAYTTDFSGKGIDRLIGQAKANAENANEDEFNRLPVMTGGVAAKPYDLFDKKLGRITSDEKIDIARSMERKALKYDSKITKVLRSSFSTSEYEVGVANSAGLKRIDTGTLCSIDIDVVAGDDKEIQTGGDMMYKRFVDDLDIDGTVEAACNRAVSMLGSRKVDSASVPVIFDPLVTCQFIDVLSGSLCADSVQKGRSMFAGKVGSKIADSSVSLIDDGTLARGVGTFMFDAEGADKQKTILIKDGVLQGYLFNDYTANKGNMKSTGNAVRSFNGLPGVGPSNMILEAGNTDKDSLLDIERGIYVFGVLGMHMIDTISGDFSIGVNGMWVEKGKCVYSVSGVTIAGNISELLNSIDLIANDTKFYGGVSAPSIRINNLKLSGR